MMATAPNLGTGGTALDAQFGSSSSSNTNEPLLLTHSGTNYLYLPGVTGNYASVPDSAALSITGDIEIVMRVATSDWTPPTSNRYPAAKRNTAGNQRSWLIELTTSGNLRLYWSSNGSTETSATSTAALPFVDGTTYWIKVTFDVDNGAGGNDVKFWYAPDSTTEPSSWTQLGSTITTAGVTSIFDSTAQVTVGGWQDGGQDYPWSFYRLIMRSGIGGTVVLDANFATGITSGAQASFTESSSNAATVTINRSASGRKSVAVVRPVWLLGTDDYFEVADNDLLDFTNTQDFTLVSVIRAWGTTADDTIIAKKTSTAAATVGYALEMSTSSATTGRLSDGTTQHSPTATTRTAGALTVLSLVRSGTTVTAYHNATAGTPVTITATGTFANSEVMRLGRLSGSGTNYLDGELVAAMVFRRALSSTELAQIATYYGVA